MDVVPKIITDLSKLAPIIGVLLLGLIYFIRKEYTTGKTIRIERVNNQKRIDLLNKEIRSNEKDNLEMLNKLADALDKISVSTNNVSDELRDFKNELRIKLSELKNR